jgi:hypothetical protein
MRLKFNQGGMILVTDSCIFLKSQYYTLTVKNNMILQYSRPMAQAHYLTLI